MIVKPLYKEIGFPVTTLDAKGRRTELTAELLETYVQATREQIVKGFRILCFDGHETNENEDIKGRWIDLGMINGRVYGVIQPNSEDDRNYIKNLDTSMVLSANVRINENVIPVMITRIDVVGQGAIAYTSGFKEPEDFEFSKQLAALGSSNGAECMYLSFFNPNDEEPEMKATKLMARMLGLPETASDEEVVKAMYARANAEEADEEANFTKMKRYFMREGEDKEKASLEKAPESEADKAEQKKAEMAKDDPKKEIAAMGRQSVQFMLSRVSDEQKTALLGNYDKMVGNGLSPAVAMEMVGQQVSTIESSAATNAEDPTKKTIDALNQFNPNASIKLSRPEPQKDAVTQSIDEGIAFWDDHFKENQ